MQVQKEYNIHNNIAVNPSEKLTQSMCVNPDIVQTHWMSCLRKQDMTVVAIIGPIAVQTIKITNIFHNLTHCSSTIVDNKVQHHQQLLLSPVVGDIKVT